MKIDQFNSPVTKQIEQGAHGWVQWKGTDACMDFHCKCGYQGHVDGKFVYYIECPECHALYEVSGFVEMIEADESNRNNAIKATE